MTYAHLRPILPRRKRAVMVTNKTPAQLAAYKVHIWPRWKTALALCVYIPCAIIGKLFGRDE